MTKRELIDRLHIMTIARKDRDPAMDHIKADRLLIKFIDDIEIESEFDNIEKWYN